MPQEIETKILNFNAKHKSVCTGHQRSKLQCHYSGTFLKELPELKKPLN